MVFDFMQPSVEVTLSVNFFGFVFLESHPSLLARLKFDALIPDYADNVDVLSMDAVLEICAKYSIGNELRMHQLVTLVKGALGSVLVQVNVMFCSVLARPNYQGEMARFLPRTLCVVKMPINQIRGGGAANCHMLLVL